MYLLDIKSVVLNGVLKQEVYVDQSLGFIVQNEEDKVYKFHKALYGLKQAPRPWYDEINSYCSKGGLQKSLSEATLHTKTNGNLGIIMVSLYVNDIIYTRNFPSILEEFKSDMMKHYEMTDLGPYIIFLV